MKRIVLFCHFVMCALCGFCATEDIGGITWYYVVKDGAATIYRSDDLRAVSGTISGVVNVPSSIGGYPVTSIGYSAFYKCSKITSVIIPSGVTNIGHRAFRECSALKSVTIPNSVRSIGYWAFLGCGSLTSVTIPSGVTSVYESFSNCSGLMSFVVAEGNLNYKSENNLLLTKDGKTLVAGVNGDVVIPNGVTSIGDCAFYGRSGLTSVKMSASVISIGYAAFCCCDSLSCVDIPNGVTSMGSYAFSNCSGLTSIAMSEGLVSIGSYAFSHCSGLSSIVIPRGVTSIETFAFCYCAGLTNVTVTSEASSFGSCVFYGCNGLASVDFEGVPPSGLKSSSIPTDASIRYNAKYEDEWHPVIAANGFANATAYIPTKPDGWGYEETVDGFTWTFNVLNGEAEISKMDMQGQPLRAVEPMPSGVLTIPSTLGGCPVKGIGGSALSGCDAVMAVEIHEGITRIGIRAFEGCSLSEVTFPTSLVSVGSCAFAECPLKKVKILGATFPELEAEGWSYRNYGSGLSIEETLSPMSFGYDYKAVLQTIFGRQEKDISYGSFDTMGGGCPIADLSWQSYDCVIEVSDEMADWGDGVTSGSGSRLWFYGYFRMRGIGTWQMADVVRPGWHLTTEDHASSSRYCVCGHYPALVGKVTIPKVCFGTPVWGIQSDLAGQRARSGFDKITDLVVEEGIEHISGSPFAYSKSLVSVSLPDSILSVGGWAFSGCAGLTNMTFPSSLTSIGQYAFDGCVKLETLSFAGNAPAVGDYAFRNIGTDCVNVQGDTTGWDNDGDGKWQGLTLVYAHVSDGGPYAEVVDGVEWTFVVSDGKAILGTGTTYPTAVDIYTAKGALVIPAKLGGCPVTSVGDYAFHGGCQLTSITVPAGVTNIGMNAFYMCDAATSVTLPNTVQEIGSGAFGYCTKLTSIDIPASVRIIEPGVFRGCCALNGIAVAADNPWYCSVDGVLYDKTKSTIISCPGNKESVTIVDSVTSVAACAFHDCSCLTVIDIPAGVTEIGDEAFSGCSGLVSLKIPNGVEKIGSFLFYSCYDLTSVEIPSSVTSIGGSAFWSCSGLASLTVPSGVTSVGEDAFAFCPAAVDFEGAPPEGLADAALKQDVALRYNVEYEDEWLPAVAACGFTNATAYDPQESFPELVNPTSDEVRKMLMRATDEMLVEKITTAIEYEAFRNWTGTVKLGNGELARGSGVLASPNAWLSFALGQDVLLERAPTNGQMKVEGFVQTATAGEYEFTVNIEDVVVGSEASKENLKKVFGIEGGTTLEGLSSANVNVSFGTPENGKVKFTAGPKDSEAKMFFMKVKMAP